MPDRKKVGDVDPAGKKAFDAEMAKAAKPATPAAPAAEAKKPGLVRRAREILHELADAIDPEEPREITHTVGGKPKTVMDVVDEAVTGAKEDAP